MRAVGRGDHVAFLERAADADGAGLLPDRDVEEAGQLSRAEPLLDLLLEAPDEQHLAEELAQELLGDSPLLLHLGHSRVEFMLRLVSLVDAVAGDRQRSLPERLGGRPPAARRSTTPRGCDRAAALLGAAQPRAGAATALRFSAARRGAGPCSPELVERLLARLDEERISGRARARRREARPSPSRSRTGRPSPATWDAALAALPAGLERPLRRGRARLDATGSTAPRC